MKKEKIFLAILLGMIGIDLIVIGFLSYQNQKLKNEIYQLENKLIKISEKSTNNKTLQNNSPSQNEKKFTQIPKDLFYLPQIDNNEDPFEEIKKFEEQMNQLFSQLDKNFSNRFEINITPKWWNYLHFSNTQIINWKKFHYEIEINWNFVKWNVTYDNIQTLKDIQNKLEKLWLKTKLENNELFFQWKTNKINELLKIFNIDFSETQISPENPNKNWIRRF